MRPSALSSVMLARTDRLTPFPLITSLQPQHFHTIAHSFAQRRSVIPSISNSFRTLLMLTGGGTPRDAQSFNHNLNFRGPTVGSLMLALRSALCDNRKLPEDNVSVTQPQPKFWSGNEIRETFLRFFEGKGHRRVRSSSLVPHGDPTLLFTNAGMNQFKDVFLGLEKRDYNKATTAQKCVRAGGKHNDLENVGFTKRHHTFFEMLGNFSFGPVGVVGDQFPYFKREAIAYAWELVTSPNCFNIRHEKLYVTVFGGAEILPGMQLAEDAAARDFWLEQNVAPERIYAIPGLKENFWAMGETGPCGPCIEIHFDMGPEASEQGHTDCKFPCDCGRYVEIWNLVFMEYNRQVGPDWAKVSDLPQPSIDTGMGLERVAAVLQGVISNYDTDLFVPLMKRAADLCGVDFKREEKLEEGKGGAASLRVIADHARATAFLITDGVLPSNEGRGYVLRKIIRRAVRHGRLLGATKPFLAEMAATVRNLMGAAYPELIEAVEQVSRIVYGEEKRFARTLAEGTEQMEAAIAAGQRWLKSASDESLQEFFTRSTGSRGTSEELRFVRERGKILEGREAFKLYDTFGLPVDFIEDACRDSGILFD